MTTKADRLGQKLEVVSRNISLSSSNEVLGEIIIWLFSAEAALRECIRIFSELTTYSDFKKLPPHVLSKPFIKRKKRKYLDKNRLYYEEIDGATFGALVNYYGLLRPSNKKLYRKLDKIKKGRNKIAHRLWQSKDINADYQKLFPEYIRARPQKEIFEDIIGDIRYVLGEIKKV